MTDATPSRAGSGRQVPGPAYRLAALAARALRFGDATFSLVDGQVQGVMASTRSRSDVDGQAAARLSEIVAASGAPVVVSDLAASTDPAVSRAGGAFVGVPLLDSDESVVGVLYLTDSSPRQIGPAELELLTDFAAVAADQLDLTRRAHDLEGPTERGLTALARAIGHGEIVPWYQPIVELGTGRLVGLEALARWEHPSGAFDEPAVFIPLAERTNLVVDLDRVVIRRAFLDLSRWRLRHPSLRISVNLSGRQLDRDDWVDDVQRAAAAADLDPSAVTLELTETARPNRTAPIADKVREVRELGFQVWFDDFGSGWASLQELVAYTLDGIKIDRSFAAQLDQHADSTVVRAMAKAAAELGLEVTMEGVETPEQAVAARDLGCDYGQGYLWSRPVPARLLEAMLVTEDGQLPVLDPSAQL